MWPTAVLASALVRPATVLTAAVPGGYGGGEGDGGKRGGEGGDGGGEGEGGKRGGDGGDEGGGECRSRRTTTSESDLPPAT
jgi:hypothetical protein